MGTTTSALIWSVADLLRGNFKQSEYGRVILPFTILRRLDGLLEATKPQVLKEYTAKQNLPPAALERFLVRVAGFPFYNISPFTFTTLLGDAANVRANLATYVTSFSDNVRDLFERFNFPTTLDRLDQDNLLYLVAREFAAMDLHPQRVSNATMGTLFEELIRKFAELSNETAGEHFTPREVIRLMVELLFAGDDAALTQPGIVRSLYDPTVGTGGMLSGAEQHLQRLNPQARLVVYGQELNPESYAICKADMLIKGQDISNLSYGNTLAEDGLLGKVFDYCLSNPPFGVDWKKIEKVIREEYARRGYDGRFGPGLPRVSDGSLLFLLHLISKMRPKAQGGGRIGIVLNGSPLFTGGAGSGESEIRRWIIENDWLEAIVALPTDMFYNTGIATYVWLVTNHKAPARRGKIQLINASDFYQKMRKSLGSKRKELGAADIARIVKLYGDFEQNAYSKIFQNDDFGYHTITVERPLRDEQGKIVLGIKGKQKGQPLPDVALRDTENVPLIDDIGAYMEQEVLPHVPDAWVDHDKTKVGYEIPFNRHFYQYVPPRPLAEIDADLKVLSAEIMGLLQEVTA
ncbi:MAG: SAM-dependent DNA methyltransferase [Chromatiaceae bacterium]|nr:SAM-dependent DNA methyltransferase [Chromatiaceae bacterium]